MKKVHWRPIADNPLYWVGSDGRVKSFKRQSPIDLMPCVNKGYLRVGLWSMDTGDTKQGPIHRLNHEDGNKLNNDYTNLRWIDNDGKHGSCN